MNSDLVYKKKYLKYKSKYTALQQQMNVQDGGLGGIKSGMYLFIVDTVGYNKYVTIFDTMGLPKDDYLADSGNKIPQLLGNNSFFVPRSIVDGSLNLGIGTFNLGNNDVKRCGVNGEVIPLNSTQFTRNTQNVEQLKKIAQDVANALHNKGKIDQEAPLTHFFVVEYNDFKSNRISFINLIQ
jgi:hypothetical protein